MEFSIREATQGDFDALCAIFAEADATHRKALPHIFREVAGPARPREFILGILADENAALFVAEHKGEIVGLIRISIRETPNLPIFVPRRYAVISELVVKEGFRRHGVGRALLERAERWAIDQGVRQIELVVWEFNKGAIAFYEKHGYKTISRRMWKPLNQTLPETSRPERGSRNELGGHVAPEPRPTETSCGRRCLWQGDDAKMGPRRSP